MNGSGSGGGKGFGHRYLGPKHVLLGILVEGQSQAAQLLRSYGVEVTAARAGIGGSPPTSACPRAIGGGRAAAGSTPG